MNRRDFLKATTAAGAAVLPDCETPEPTLAGGLTAQALRDGSGHMVMVSSSWSPHDPFTKRLTDEQFEAWMRLGRELEWIHGPAKFRARLPSSPVTYRPVSVSEPYEGDADDCPAWMLDTARARGDLDWLDS